ncbi:MAG: hypothetical protein AAFR90_14835 [Pseudomonadota bacterium]
MKEEKFKHTKDLFLFFDDFSEVDSEVQDVISSFAQRFAQVVNWKRVGIDNIWRRVAVYPNDENKVAFLRADATKRIGVSLFKSSVGEKNRYNNLDEALKQAGLNLKELLNHRTKLFELNSSEDLFRKPFGTALSDFGLLCRLCGGSVRRLGQILSQFDDQRSECNPILTKEIAVDLALQFWAQRWQEREDQERSRMECALFKPDTEDVLRYTNLANVLVGNRFILADNKLLGELEPLIARGYLYLIFGGSGALNHAGKSSLIFLGINDAFLYILGFIDRDDMFCEQNEICPNFDDSHMLQAMTVIRELRQQIEQEDTSTV